MSEQEPVEDLVKKVKRDRGRRVTVLGIAVVVLVIVFLAVVIGFRGTDIEESSAAMVPVPRPALDASAPSDG